GRRRRLRHRTTAETRERSERSVGAEPHAVDRGLTRLHEKRRRRPDVLGRERSGEALEEIGPRLGVVVEQDDHIARTESSAAVARVREAAVLSELENLDPGKGTRVRRRSIGRAAVDDDDTVWHRLKPKELEAALGQPPAVPGGNDDIYRRSRNAL